MKARMVSPSRIALDRHPVLGLTDGREDVRIGGAAAEIAAHILADLLVAARMPLLDAGDRLQDLSRRAVAALEGVLVDEGLLHGMELSVGSAQPLDGGDRLAHRGGQRE